MTTNEILTDQQRNSIKSAIADCDRYIAKESPRSERLRPAEIKKLLAWYISHRSNLIERLSK